MWRWGVDFRSAAKKRVDMVNRCALCKEEAKSIDHILLHCNKARILWQLVFSIFDIWWLISTMVTDALLRWHGPFIGRRCIRAWRATPLCLFWTIGKERNRRCFESEKMSDQRLKCNFFNNLSLWITVYIGGGSIYLVDFIDWLGLYWRREYFLFPLFFV